MLSGGAVSDSFWKGSLKKRCSMLRQTSMENKSSIEGDTARNGVKKKFFFYQYRALKVCQKAFQQKLVALQFWESRSLIQQRLDRKQK